MAFVISLRVVHSFSSDMKFFMAESRACFCRTFISTSFFCSSKRTSQLSHAYFFNN